MEENRMNFATLEAPALADAIRVVGFRGTERLCRPYEFELFAQVEGQGRAADLEEAISSAAKLTLQRDQEQPQIFQGILANVSLVQQMPAWALYRLELVPRLWQLGLTRHSRVFTKQSVPDTIQSVLEAAGFGPEDFELRLDGDYASEELVVQYAESNLDFLQRWMEHEGLYYFFEQTDGGEKLVIVDHGSFHQPMVDKKVRYFPLAGHDTSAGECFDTFAAIRAATVGRVKVADYDYARPMLDVSADQRVSERGFDEIRVHAGRFFDPEQAKRFARIRAEELKAREMVYHAAGTALHMSAGYLVELSEHASDGFNKGYLLTEVHHFCNQLQQEGDSHLGRIVKPEFEDVYRVEVKAADASQPYRAPQSTPKPRVMGFEGAVVDGPADSQYAQLDEQGRYQVRFRFDESDLPDGKRSTYVRMMQPYGGTTEGFHFPLRKGTEVMIAFDGGDPDRPFIAGAIPNATTPSPVTDANPEMNIIQTSGDNFIKFNDREDEQFYQIGSPVKNGLIHVGYKYPVFGMGKPPTMVDANLVLRTDGVGAFKFGSDWHIDVGGVKNEHVKGAVVEKYDTSQDTTVTGPRNDTVTGAVVEMYGPLKNVVNGDAEYTHDNTTFYTGKYTLEASGAISMSGTDYTVKVGPYNIKAGPTAAKLGPTSVNVGPLSGQIASINLSIPGGVGISTPKWDVSNPDETWLSANMKFSSGNKAEYVGVALSITGAKIEAIHGLARTTGVKLENTGMYKVNGGTEIKMTGPSIKAAAVNAVTAGLISLL
jgi:type VI secretion system secreted protein VgrG